MAALSGDLGIVRRDGVMQGLPVEEAQVIYLGALVMVNAAGYAQPGADDYADPAHIFGGVATERVDNSAGGDGAATVVVYRRGQFRFACASSATQANVGDKVYLIDDQTVALAADATNDIYCGIIAGIEETEVWVDIDPAILQA